VKRGSVLATLFACEIRMLLRDRRTIMIVVVAPFLLFPLMMFTARAAERTEQRRLDETRYTYAVGGTLGAEADAWVEGALSLAKESEDSTLARTRFDRRAFPTTDVEAAVSSDSVDVVVVALPPEEYRALVETERASADSAIEAAGEAAGSVGRTRADSTEAPQDPDDSLDVPVLRLLYRADRAVSRTAAERMDQALSDLRQQREERRFQERGLAVDRGSVLALDEESIASAEKEGGALIGLILTPLLVLLMLSGGSVVAADTIAGEKERGTLETILTTGAKRSEIVRAKLFAVIAVGIVVIVVNVLNIVVYLSLGLLDLPANFRVGASPAALASLAVLFLPLTVLAGSALLLLSGYAKSYKEYQIYFFPVFMLFMVPAAAGVLPGTPLRSLVAVIPIAGIALAVRDVMLGDYDVLGLSLAFASTSVAAWGLARLTSRTLSTERLISRSELDAADLFGGPAMFHRRVLLWFGGMWVALLLISVWGGEDLGIRSQIFVNLILLFLGGSVFLLRRYQLPVREALALRPVAPVVWLAVLIGAPSALLVGNGVAQLAEHILPVPQRVLESFGQYLLPESLPLWQIVLFLAVLPGICEEIAFRGVLMYGLSKHLRPVPLALAVGAIFGVFHVAIFRILPTAYLGVVLAAVTLLTGSIFPAMVWHALNNATALVPARLGLMSAEVQVEPWMYQGAVIGLALAFWILWRTRRPYRRAARE
jgi:sodium transport system permease protein